MKQLLAIAVLVICSPSWEQQNLVPNGSFEEYTLCPSENEYLIGLGNFTRCKDWWYPHIGTPDYFNSCNNFENGGSGYVGVPNNFRGYQFALDGNAYVGLGLFEYVISNSEVSSREMIQCKLTSKMKPCSKYQISFFCSLANESTHGVDKLAFYFTEDSLGISNLAELEDIKPSWTYNEVIDDTTEWVYVVGDYVAFGKEKFLTIGIFESYDSLTLSLNDSGSISGFQSNLPYVYLDDVEILEIGKQLNCKFDDILPNVFTPDGNGANDFIDFSSFEKVTILNRWGNTVLVMSSQSNFQWHGKNFREEDLPTGVYFYIAEKAGIRQTGSIHLIR